MVNEAGNEVAEAMCPADDNNMHPGKLHSRYSVERLNVAREAPVRARARWRRRSSETDVTKWRQLGNVNVFVNVHSV